MVKLFDQSKKEIIEEFIKKNSRYRMTEVEDLKAVSLDFPPMLTYPSMTRWKKVYSRVAEKADQKNKSNDQEKCFLELYPYGNKKAIKVLISDGGGSEQLSLFQVGINK